MALKKGIIKIIEQPASKALRFRYECEGRSAGSIPGANSTSENKTFPEIQVVGYQGKAIAVVSCVTKDEPYLAHPHNIVGKGCKMGVCTVIVPPDSMRVQFPNLGIQCVKKRDIEWSLRQREQIRVDPFRQGFDHRHQPTSIDLGAVRLCFQVFLEGGKDGKFTIPLRPVVSDVIYDKKTNSDLTIIKMSDCVSYVDGGRKDMILLCEKVAKEDIEVHFYEEWEGQRVWHAKADFQPFQVHKQYAIWFRTPRYHTLEVSEPVKVYIQLYRPSDRMTSEAVPLELLPSAARCENLKRKRTKMDLSSVLGNKHIDTARCSATHPDENVHAANTANNASNPAPSPQHGDLLTTFPPFESGNYHYRQEHVDQENLNIITQKQNHHQNPTHLPSGSTWTTISNPRVLQTTCPTWNTPSTQNENFDNQTSNHTLSPALSHHDDLIPFSQVKSRNYLYKQEVVNQENRNIMTRKQNDLNWNLADQPSRSTWSNTFNPKSLKPKSSTWRTSSNPNENLENQAPHQHNYLDQNNYNMNSACCVQNDHNWKFADQSSHSTWNIPLNSKPLQPTYSSKKTSSNPNKKLANQAPNQPNYQDQNNYHMNSEYLQNDHNWKLTDPASCSTWNIPLKPKSLQPTCSTWKTPANSIGNLENQASNQTRNLDLYNYKINSKYLKNELNDMDQLPDLNSLSLSDIDINLMAQSSFDSLKKLIVSKNVI